MQKPVFVTGGCGFVGRHLVKKLLAKGDSIWILDNLSTGKHPDVWLQHDRRQEHDGVIQYAINGAQEVVFIRMDALNFFIEQINKASRLAIPAFSDIYHLASIVGGRELIDGDPILVATDFGIDALFFVWVTRNKDAIDRIMYASSSAAYPIHLQNVEHQVAIAMKEDMIRFDEGLGQPDMTYGWSKLSGEFLSRLAAKKYGLHVACIRPFSGYGEDQDITYPVPAIARRIAKRENPVEVWGSGQQGRDFVHIDDCIDAMFTVLDYVKDGSGVNIGSGALTSFIELIRLFAKIEGYTPEIKPLLDKPVGVTSRYSDPNLISSFGWHPAISITEGMTRVLAYAKDESRSVPGSYDTLKKLFADPKKDALTSE